MPASKASLLPTSRKITALILGNSRKAAVPDLAKEAEFLLAEQGAQVHIDLSATYEPIDTKPDLVVVIGGDGSILAASHRLGNRRVPVLGVNVGKVGFLAAIPPHRLSDVIRELFMGKYRLERRSMMAFTVRRGDDEVFSSHFLNELVVQRLPEETMMSIELVDERRQVCNYVGDGLIVSTSTGSTAYNLSAGGPILAPSLDALVLQPLAPYTLAMRPLVVRNDRHFILRVANSGTLNCDGHLKGKLRKNDKIRLSPSNRSLKLIVDVENRFYERLRSKLHWGTEAGSG